MKLPTLSSNLVHEHKFSRTFCVFANLDKIFLSKKRKSKILLKKKENCLSIKTK